jgi:hypothetical protein
MDFPKAQFRSGALSLPRCVRHYLIFPRSKYFYVNRQQGYTWKKISVEVHFKADFQPTKFGGDYDAPNYFRRIFGGQIFDAESGDQRRLRVLALSMTPTFAYIHT